MTMKHKYQVGKGFVLDFSTNLNEDFSTKH